MTKWNGSPALGVILLRLVALAARVERVHVATQAQANARIVGMIGKGAEK